MVEEDQNQEKKGRTKNKNVTPVPGILLLRLGHFGSSKGGIWWCLRRGGGGTTMGQGYMEHIFF